MNKQLLALHLERGRLLECIAHQRVALAVQLVPLKNAAFHASRVVKAGQAGVGFVRSNPWLMLVSLAVVFALRPKGLWRLARTGMVVWRGWRTLRAILPAPALSSLYQFVLQRFIRK